MPKKSPILLITAILGLLAIGGVALVSLMPKGGPAPDQVAVAPTPTPTPSAVWVANRNIPVRTAITTLDLRKSNVTGVVPPDAVTDIAQLKDQLTKYPIRAGETVTLASFAPAVRRVQPANFEIPTGTRAFTIYAEIDSTMAGLIDVGDRVDVVATHRLRAEKQENQFVIGATEYTAGRLMGRNLPVLAVDASIKAPAPTPTPLPNQAAAVPNGAPPPPPPPPAPAGPATTRTRIVLAAPPELATRIITAGDQGQLSLLLRNPNDADAAEVPEQRQYPSRIANKREVTTAARDLGRAVATGVREGMGFPKIPPQPQPIPDLPTENKTPMDLGNIPTIPQPDPTPAPQEITVIRGTEKTRVLVPQR